MPWPSVCTGAASAGARTGAVASIFIFCALGGLLFGWDIGATAYVLTQVQSADKAGVAWGERIEANSALRGFFTASAVGGALVGTMIVLQVESWLGRRRELLLASCLYMLGGMTEFGSSFVSNDVGLAICLPGRWVYGGGIAFAMHAAPAYLAEMSPPSIRGLLVAAKEGMIVLGILFAQIAGFHFQDAEGGWRWTFFLSVPLAALMGAGMLRLPPSARWLALQGRWEEAEASLRFFMKCGVGLAMEEIKASMVLEDVRLREGGEEEGREEGGSGARNQSSSSSSSSNEKKFTRHADKKDAKHKPTISQVIRNPRYRRALIVGIGVVTLQQISGQPSVLYFCNEILRDFGLSDSATLLVGLFKLIATMGTVFTVDRYGRRTLLLTGIAVMLVALALLTTAFAFDKEDEVEATGQALDILLIGALFLYIAGYQIGFGPISWILVSEIYPTEVRGETVALAVMANFAFNLVVTFAFDSLRESLGTSATFGLFLGIAAGGWAFVYVLLPETNGLSLEMIEAKFAASALSPFSRWSRGGRVDEVGGRGDEREGLLAWFHRRVCATSGREQQQQQQQPAAVVAAAAGAGGGATQMFIESLLPVEKLQQQQQQQ
ncbi:hypothetical protein VYU27_001181 [Nannochloropsis oceanica]